MPAAEEEADTNSSNRVSSRGRSRSRSRQTSAIRKLPSIIVSDRSLSRSEKRTKREIRSAELVAQLLGALLGLGVQNYLASIEYGWHTRVISVICCTLCADFWGNRRGVITIAWWYSMYLVLAIVASPALGFVQSQQYFGKFAGGSYAMVLSRFNTNIIFWCLVNHVTLILEKSPSLESIQLAGCVFQLAVARLQSMHHVLSRGEALNCHMMLITIVMGHASIYYRKHSIKTPPTSVKIHIFILLSYVFTLMLTQDPLAELFGIHNQDARKVTPKVAALQWLIAFMILELIYALVIVCKPNGVTLGDMYRLTLSDFAKLSLILYNAVEITAFADSDKQKEKLLETAGHFLLKSFTIAAYVSDIKRMRL